MSVTLQYQTFTGGRVFHAFIGAYICHFQSFFDEQYGCHPSLGRAPTFTTKLVCIARFRRTYLSSVGLYCLPLFSRLKIFAPVLFFDRKASVERELFAVGPACFAHVRGKVHDLIFEAHGKHEEERNQLVGGSSSDEIIDDLGVGDEEKDEDLLSLDPKEWKGRPSEPFNGTARFFSHPRFETTETRPLRRPRTLTSPV